VEKEQLTGQRGKWKQSTERESDLAYFDGCFGGPGNPLIQNLCWYQTPDVNLSRCLSPNGSLVMDLIGCPISFLDSLV